MIMIVGGAFQGKTEYAKKRFGFVDADISDGGKCGFGEAFSAKCVNKYHLLIKRLLETGEDPQEYTAKLCRENPGAVLIIDEIGCGIVPLEKSERRCREETGRAGCMVAEKSKEVVRVCCGIPTRIKEKHE